jgi:hypothetical protein
LTVPERRPRKRAEFALLPGSRDPVLGVDAVDRHWLEWSKAVEETRGNPDQTIWRRLEQQLAGA